MDELSDEVNRGDAGRGALVGAAVGDGLGASFEGAYGPVPVDRIESAAATPGPWPITDDTIMTIGVAESLVGCNGLDEDHMAATFAAAYARDPARGYGAGAARLLGRIAAGEDWRTQAADQFGGRGSFGNGAAMRSAPFGVYAAGEPATAAALARRAARITHTHPLGMEGAAALAAAVATLTTTPATEPVDGATWVASVTATVLDEQMQAGLTRAADLAATQAAPSAVAEELGTGVAALEAVPAAFWAFLRAQGSFPDVLLLAIGLGGDTDTIGSMVGALAGAHLGGHAIPATWRERTEGTAALCTLADRLHDLPGPPA